MAGWIAAAATRRGEGHARRGERGQDAFRVAQQGATLIAVAADGAGSAVRGGAGSALACRAICAAAQTTLAAKATAEEADAEAWVAAARARIAAAAAAHGLAPRDLATTVVFAVSDGASTLVGHVGDGAAVGRTAEGWRALSWPAAGEHAGATFFLTDEACALRVARLCAPVDALALFTDGIERLVLDFAARTPHAPFFERMTAPLRQAGRGGRDTALSRALRDYLGAEGFAARTDDDRTLILAARMAAA
ncbi:MAG: PP2C family serine/threonine-protein phosphatase [Rubrimonas sp.]|uniref:PP2C family serine/threonine-protein phosphatase n=1 Tax=Rubrimonas sp. TaxID=2036015 RepID=UPI002FDE8988